MNSLNALLSIVVYPVLLVAYLVIEVFAAMLAYVSEHQSH